MQYMRSKGKVFVGLSGGVDSSVSVALLKKEGYDITGVFIKVWQPHFAEASRGTPECTWKEDRLDAMRVCAKLQIPFVTLDLSKEYKKEVVDYMINEYRLGRTPNPDVMCNRHVKFGGFYEFARNLGADYIATGHYARIGYRVQGLGYSQKKNKVLLGLNPKPYTLLAGSDPQKDQSYFLWTLTQEQLAHTLFPVGGMLKSEVRKLAKKFGLPTAEKKDSQGLCFLGKIDVKEFLKSYIKPKRGKVVNEMGETIGEHDGAMFFTLGERHSFTVRTVKTRNYAERTRIDAEKEACVDQKPYYVIAKDIKKNTLTVSHDPKMTMEGNSRTEFELEQVNWIGAAPRSGAALLARLRYRQPLQQVRINNQESGIKIEFQEPQTGGTLGQSIVLYDGGVCLGGGIIV